MLRWGLFEWKQNFKSEHFWRSSTKNVTLGRHLNNRDIIWNKKKNKSNIDNQEAIFSAQQNNCAHSMIRFLNKTMENFPCVSTGSGSVSLISVRVSMYKEWLQLATEKRATGAVPVTLAARALPRICKCTQVPYSALNWGHFWICYGPIQGYNLKGNTWMPRRFWWKGVWSQKPISHFQLLAAIPLDAGYWWLILPIYVLWLTPWYAYWVYTFVSIFHILFSIKHHYILQETCVLDCLWIRFLHLSQELPAVI